MCASGAVHLAAHPLIPIHLVRAIFREDVILHFSSHACKPWVRDAMHTGNSNFLPPLTASSNSSIALVYVQRSKGVEATFFSRSTAPLSTIFVMNSRSVLQDMGLLAWNGLLGAWRHSLIGAFPGVWPTSRCEAVKATLLDFNLRPCPPVLLLILRSVLHPNRNGLPRMTIALQALSSARCCPVPCSAQTAARWSAAMPGQIIQGSQRQRSAAPAS